MNRKLLNDVRKVMSRRNFLLKSRIFKDDNATTFRSNVKLSNKKTRLSYKSSDKDYINKLNSSSK